jgi:ubiquinone/menaquinone biosynthesis C-methylase UbiE
VTVWDERAEAYRQSATRREGPDLDLVIELCEPGPGVRALDVATGGGHVARRLREAGADVVSCDPAPGMHPDVICGAEDLPFADAIFDVVVTRSAPHHFHDVAAALLEMTRVTNNRVVIQDTLFSGGEQEDAQRLRDPTHVRSYSDEEWTALLQVAGLKIERREHFIKRHRFDSWLAMTGCERAEAERVRELLADRTEGDEWLDRHIILKARKR